MSSCKFPPKTIHKKQVRIKIAAKEKTFCRQIKFALAEGLDTLADKPDFRRKIVLTNLSDL